MPKGGFVKILAAVEAIALAVEAADEAWVRDWIRRSNVVVCATDNRPSNVGTSLPPEGAVLRCDTTARLRAEGYVANDQPVE